MSDYDPGTPHDPPPHRRRRQSDSEHDDAWAAADEDDLADPGADIEDLAAGYQWEDRDPHGRERSPDEPIQYPYDIAGDRTAPAGRRRWRAPIPHSARTRQRHDRDNVYADSPSYHRDRAKRGEFGEFVDSPRRRRESAPGPMQSLGLTIPYWQILIVVILAIFAVLAAVLACAAVLAL